MRDERWIRGHEYVADAVELEVPYGETFEGMGKVWKKKEKRYKYGYKLELLMNVTTTWVLYSKIDPVRAEII